jgi:hypothetical protein
MMSPALPMGRRVHGPAGGVPGRVRLLLVLLPGRAHHLLWESELGRDGEGGGLLHHRVSERRNL